MFSTQLLKLNYLLYPPTDTAPQFLQELTPLSINLVTFQWNYKVAEWWDSGHLPGAVLGNFVIVKLTNNTQNEQKSNFPLVIVIWNILSLFAFDSNL